MRDKHVSNPNRIFVCASAGGNGTKTFSDPPGVITQVAITYGAWVVTIQTFFADGTSVKHGGDEGDGPTSFVFAVGPGEVLTSIDGWTIGGLGDDGPFIEALRFTSLNPKTGTLQQSGFEGGPFNASDGHQGYFEFQAPAGGVLNPDTGQIFPYQYGIAAFTGREGKYLVALGVLLQQITSL